MTTKKIVVFGFLGVQLDRDTGPGRWERWRPTVALGQQEDLGPARIELFTEERYQILADTVAADLALVSPGIEVRRNPMAIKNPWDFEEVYARLADFCRSYTFDPDEEDYLIHITTGTHVAQICLFLLCESGHLPGRLVQTSPSPRMNGPVVGTYSIIDLNLSRYDRLAARFESERNDTQTALKSGIKTNNAAFNTAIAEIEKVAVRSKDPILLMGPTGAGKSRLAKRIFELRKARSPLRGEFVEVNCATLRGDSAMSALFGHVKGAFTGAQTDRTGLLRAADGGLLFLDEIGELGRDEQAMLLRALEEKRFLPFGSDKAVSSDFQLICGTNRDLGNDARQGRFRDDLLARINLWTFTLPSLRDRPEDIAPNLDYELERLARATGRKTRFSKEALDLYLKFARGPEALWPGNFRDLNASLTRMATLAPGGRIGRETVETEIVRLRRQWSPESARDSDDLRLLRDLMGDAAEKLDRFERVQLLDVLKVCKESRSLSEAGRTLFAVSREEKKGANDADRLRKYLLRFGLEFERARGGR